MSRGEGGYPTPPLDSGPLLTHPAKGGLSGLPHLRQCGHRTTACQSLVIPGGPHGRLGWGRCSPAPPYPPWRPARPAPASGLVRDSTLPMAAASEGKQSRRPPVPSAARNIPDLGICPSGPGSKPRQGSERGANPPNLYPAAAPPSAPARARNTSWWLGATQVSLLAASQRQKKLFYTTLSHELPPFAEFCAKA